MLPPGVLDSHKVQDSQTEQQRLHATFALSLPEAWLDDPFGDVVAKVKKKIFVFLGTASYPAMSLKLVESHNHAMSIPGVTPTGYGLGRHGWVTFATEPDPSLPPDLIHDWIAESYVSVAPKSLGSLAQRQLQIAKPSTDL